MSAWAGLDEVLRGPADRVHAGWPAGRLIEAALARREGMLADNGALVVRTGAFTGRSPEDKYVVSSDATEPEVWWGAVNHRLERAAFDALVARAVAHLARRELFVFDGWAGAAPGRRLPLRVVAEKAWHALFASTLFLRPAAGPPAAGEGGGEGEGGPPFTVLHAGTLAAGGPAAGVRSDVFIGIDFDRRLVLILGTEYAGEIKKAIFTVMSYLLPRQGTLSMHCAANVGARGDVALFFGLSGTGKTTLSADPGRDLIGDDETAWSDDGVFNIEGGCYAKCIGLRRESEPQIFDAIRFGSVLENVVVDPATRAVDYASAAITENTRATYPVEFIPHAVIPSRGPHPRTVLFLTADAFGVLPPVARLTPAQAMYHYISGYTAKVAGTEAGVRRPTATFSPCFGGPFLALPPMRYARLLGEKLARHRATCWLVNTGWTGGPHGVGSRMRIDVSRAVVGAALSGALDSGEGGRFQRDPVFGFEVPEACPGVPAELLRPRATWADPGAYDAQARQLAQPFRANFEPYAAQSDPAVRGAGPAAG